MERKLKLRQKNGCLIKKTCSTGLANFAMFDLLSKGTFSLVGYSH